MNKVLCVIIGILLFLISFLLVRNIQKEKQIKELTISNITLETSKQTLEKSVNELKRRNKLLQQNEEKKKQIKQDILKKVNYDNSKLEDIKEKLNNSVIE